MEILPATARPRKRRRVVRRRDPLANLPKPLRDWLTETIVPAWRTISAPPVLLLLVLALPALLVAFQFQATHRIDVGTGNDGFYLRGSYAQEQGNGTDFRWLSGNSEIIVPGAPGNSTWDASLRISNGRPFGGPPVAIRVLADGREVARFTVDTVFRDYTFQFHRPPLAEQDLRLSIEGQTFDPPGEDDNRQLGIVLDTVSLSPARDRAAEPYIYPPAYAIAVLALLVGVAGLLGYLGTPILGGAAAVFVLLGGLLVGQIREPDTTTAYIDNLLLILATTTIATVVLRPLVRRLYARGGVILTLREERWLGGIFAFGALGHLAGVFFPGFAAHDLIFQTYRVEDILRGNFLLFGDQQRVGLSAHPLPTRALHADGPLRGGHRRPLRRYVPAAPPPAADHRCHLALPDLLSPPPLSPPRSGPPHRGLLLHPRSRHLPAPLVGVLLQPLRPVGDPRRPHPGDRALRRPRPPQSLRAPRRAPRAGTPLTPRHFCAHGRDDPDPGPRAGLEPSRRSAGCDRAPRGTRRRGGRRLRALLCPLHRTCPRRGVEHLNGTRDATAGDNDRGWEDDYIANRLFVMPFALYFAAACITGVRLIFAQGRERALGWLVTAIVVTASIFAAIHVATGLWVRYFVFLTPALAIGLGVGLAWLTSRGRWARGLVWLALAYCTISSLLFWFSVTATGNRSPYP